MSDSAQSARILIFPVSKNLESWKRARLRPPRGTVLEEVMGVRIQDVADWAAEVNARGGQLDLALAGRGQRALRHRARFIYRYCHSTTADPRMGTILEAFLKVISVRKPGTTASPMWFGVYGWLSNQLGMTPGIYAFRPARQDSD